MKRSDHLRYPCRLEDNIKMYITKRVCEEWRRLNWFMWAPMEGFCEFILINEIFG
jgi:hypothetical protein